MLAAGVIERSAGGRWPGRNVTVPGIVAAPRLRRARPRGLLAWLALLCLVAASCKVNSADRLAPKDVEEATIVASITPGKPGAPQEVVSLVKRSGSCSLTVQRIDNSGKTLGEARASLVETSFAAVWDLIERHELRTMTPKPGQEKAFDFGERRLRLEWRKTGHDGPVSRHELRWDQPLAHEQDRKVKAVLSQLANLAKQHAPATPLYYFPAQP